MIRFISENPDLRVIPLYTESMAAVSGGVTSFMEMPNTIPQSLTQKILEEKFKLGDEKSLANYAFYLGGTGRTGPNLGKWENAPGICGIKIFMGASTGDLLAASDEEVASVLSNGKRVVAVHAEDQYIMEANMKTILKDNHDVSLHCIKFRKLVLRKNMVLNYMFFISHQPKN